MPFSQYMPIVLSALLAALIGWIGGVNSMVKKYGERMVAMETKIDMMLSRPHNSRETDA